MKKFLLILLASSFLYSCSVVEDGKASINNVVEEAGRVKEELKDAQEKVGETINDIKKAGEKIDEAKSAIEEISK